MMASQFRRTTAFGALLAAFLIAPARAHAQTTAELVDGLAGYVKKKNDGQAVAVIDQLTKTFGKISDDEKKTAITAIEHTLNAQRDDNDDKLFEAAVASFSEMGEPGEKATIRALKAPNVDKRRGVLAAALRSLGAHKDASPATIKLITDYLVHSEPAVVAGAADALANYSDQPEKVRKPIVEELIKNYSTFASAASNTKQPAKDQTRAKERLSVVERPFLSTLEKMTGQKFATFAEWQKWYQENKGKKWDPAGKG